MFENMIRQMQKDSPLDFETLDWSALSTFKYLSEEFIEDFLYKLNIKAICSNQILSEKFLRKYKNIIDFKTISNTQVSNVSYDYIFENKNKLDMNIINKNKKYIESLKNHTSQSSKINVISSVYKENWILIMENLRNYGFFDDINTYLLKKSINTRKSTPLYTQDTNFFDSNKYITAYNITQA